MRVAECRKNPCCLISLNDDLSIGKIAQLIKGESLHWINQNKLIKLKFEWQDEYLAIGIGDDKIEMIRQYIANQGEHHKKINFNINMINLLNGMDLILLNINSWFGLKPVFFSLYFEHDINVVPNDVHIIKYRKLA